MAFNGSGTFVRLYNWVNDAAANIKIRADRMDAEMDGMATGLSTCITKNGQTTITANLPMATYRHTGVGAAVNRTDYARTAEVQDGSINWVDGGGTADAITAAYGIPLTALVDGQLCFVRATAANATTTPTFSPSGLTARTIVKNGDQALVAGDIAGDGHELILRYRSSDTKWELLNPAIPTASETVAGKVELATDAETITGTDTTRATTPANVKAALDDRASDYATAAQGATADTAVQPGDMIDVGSAGAFGGALLHLQDQKTAGTEGGTFTSGAWQTRTLNTEVTDEIGSTLSSNQFTLPAGTYYIEAEAPGFVVGVHKAKLYNITDADDVLIGTSVTAQSSSSGFSTSSVSGRFTIAATKTFEIRHQCQITKTTNGFGAALSFSVIEVFADVRIWKVA